MRAHVEDLLCNRGRYAEAAGGVLAVDDEEIDLVGLHHMGQMFADDVRPAEPKMSPTREYSHEKASTSGLRFAANARGLGAEAEKQLDCDGSCAIPRGVDFAGSPG